MPKPVLSLLCLLMLASPVLARSATPRFEPSPCLFSIPDGEVEGNTLDCGTLYVLEDHNNPSSPEIKLAVATLYADSDNPAADPIIYLEGGPGGSALDGVDTWRGLPFLNDRDVILLDQRGTGYSKPTLDCPELDTYDDELAGTQACHDRLVNAGVALADYTSAQSAADVADLRTAMTLGEINLFGISYGTRLALTVMRDHPEGIRSVIIDSVYPPQVNAYEEYGPRTAAVFNTLYNGCAANPDCNAAYPNLQAVLAETVAALNDAPASYTATDPDTGEQYDSTLSGDDLIDTIFEALYDNTQIPYIPMVIYGVHQGHYTLADDLYYANFGYRRQAQVDVSTSEGMYNSVECREEVPFNNQQMAAAAAEAGPVELQSDTVGFIESTYDDCQIWNVPPADPIENQPVVSDLPTLIFTGEYDPITPADWGKQTARTLSHSFFYKFPGVGHDAIDSDPCPLDMAIAFLDNPTSQPDSSCIAEMSEPDFAVQ